MDIHCYFGIENLALPPGYKQQLVQMLCALGPSQHPQPACLNHWRIRLDGEAVIFEALFNTDNLSIAAFKTYLAAALPGVEPGQITHSIVDPLPTFGDYTTLVVLFGYDGTNYIRAALFGCGLDEGPPPEPIWPTWEQSGNECRGYLLQYQDLWEPELP